MKLATTPSLLRVQESPVSLAIGWKRAAKTSAEFWHSPGKKSGTVNCSYFNFGSIAVIVTFVS